MEVVKVNEINLDLQRRLDATKARNKVLSNEIKSLKSQLSILNEKGRHDNELITTLMKQQETLQKLVEQNLTAKDKIEKAGVVFSKELHNKSLREQAELSRLRQLLSERDERVRQLEQNLEDVKNDSSSQDTLAQDSQVFSEVKRDLEEARLECTKFRTLYNSMSLEHEKLSQLVAVLSKRVEEVTLGCQEAIRKYQDERKRIVKLENILEQSKGSKHESTARDVSSTSSSSLPPEARLSELETLLSIQMDENTALKESLNSTLKAKQEDVSLLQEMMEQTKSVFLDALRKVSSK